MNDAPDIDHLRDVYSRMLPYRIHWPDSFERAMRNPVIAGTVAIMCKHPEALQSWLSTNIKLARHGDIARRAEHEAATPAIPVLHQLSKGATRGVGRRAPFKGVDLKRRASGEKEENDR